MSAKEMFGELGYEQMHDDKGFIVYRNDDGGYKSYIKFISNFKRVSLESVEEYENNKEGGVTLYLEHFKAIQKQIEELGWEV